MAPTLSRLNAAIFLKALLLACVTTQTLGVPTGPLDKRGGGRGGRGSSGFYRGTKKDLIIGLSIAAGSCLLLLIFCNLSALLEFRFAPLCSRGKKMKPEVQPEIVVLRDAELEAEEVHRLPRAP